MREVRLAVVGATGAVGRNVLKVLEQRSFPSASVRAIATARSAGRKLPFSGGELTVVEISDDAFDGIDLAIFDTPDDAALEWVPRARAKGVVAVDNSAAYRLQDDVPLVVPEINPGDAKDHRGIVANPNCTAVSMLLPLAPLHRAFGARRVVAASYQSVSGAGQPGVTDLYDQLDKLLPERDAVAAGDVSDLVPVGTAFTHPIAFNLIPHVGSFGDGGFTSEEGRMRSESRKILGAPSLSVFATCVRVPTVVSHGVAVWVEFESEPDVAGARKVLQEAAGVGLEDDTETTRYPTVMLASGQDKAYVGRIRKDPAEPSALGFFATCDNLRKGAALNAVQVAELLVDQGLL
jgi:aspartate-semialdehyde dehydrogenase